MAKTYLMAAFLFLVGCSVAETQKSQPKIGQAPTNIADSLTTDGSTSRSPYVPPRGPTYGAAAVVPRNLTQGKIPYGSR
jgi:hypothetical protein